MFLFLLTGNKYDDDDDDDICWCCLDRGPGSFDVEDATTLSWSSAAVSESKFIQHFQSEKRVCVGWTVDTEN